MRRVAIQDPDAESSVICRQNTVCANKKPDSYAQCKVRYSHISQLLAFTGHAEIDQGLVTEQRWLHNCGLDKQHVCVMVNVNNQVNGRNLDLRHFSVSIG